MTNKNRKTGIFTIISIAILVISAVLTVFVYRPAVLRLWEALKSCGKSFAYYFVYLFTDSIEAAGKQVPVINPPAAERPLFAPYTEYIGIDIEALFTSISTYFSELLNIFNFFEYNEYISNNFVIFLLYCTIYIPLGYIIFTILSDSFFKQKDDSLGEKSRGYRIFVKLCIGVKRFILATCELVEFFVSKRYFKRLFVLIWLLNFGLLTFIPDFFAFYLYFFASLEAVSFVYLLLSFLLDALIVLRSVPLWLLLVFVCVGYHTYHRNKALDELRHNEAKNCGVLKELDLILLIIGEPGKGKTTLIVDMILSLVNIYKTDSLAILYKLEMFFPGFDFASFRAVLVPKIETHEIYCLPDARDFANELYDAYEQSSDASVLFGYELELYGDGVKLGNRTLSLRKALEIYAKAFFVYQTNNPSVANFSIRFDGYFDDSPYLKLWNGDFFENDGASYYSHILDADIMRFGKKVNPAGEFNGSFGFGIWTRTEADKSYGNQLSNARYNADSDEANPLNDLTEYSLKICRHANSMVDNKVFFKMLMDLQRPTDLRATVRELCTVVNITDKSELKLAIGGYGWLFRLRDKLSAFESFYLKYANARADFTLLFMLPKLAVSCIRMWCERLENIYGYRELTLVCEAGTTYSGTDGVKKEPKTYTWYLSNMKVYADRFASDCYAEFITKLQQSCGKGINDYPEYKDIYPSFDDFQSQNDFFIKKLMEFVYGFESEFKKQSNTSQEEEYYDCWDDFIL